jgi:hypothetical protein
LKNRDSERREGFAKSVLYELKTIRRRANSSLRASGRAEEKVFSGQSPGVHRVGFLDRWRGES